MSTEFPESAPLSSPMPTPSTTGVLERELVEQPVEPGDHERFSHYAPKDKIVESMVTGTPLIALCGKVWVPSRDPNRFPVCPMCKEIYDGLRKDGGDGDKDGGSSD
jgi:hypothetical protein